MMKIEEAILYVLAVLQSELTKANEGNKAAAARARKATLELEKLGKEFRRNKLI